MSKLSEITGFRLTKEEMAQLCRLAREAESSVSAYLRWLLKRHIDAKERIAEWERQ